MSAVEAQVESLAAAAPADASPSFLRRLLKRRLAVACLAYLAVIVLIAIFAPIFLPGVSGEEAGDFTAVHEGPSAAHPLGTDTLGRDVLDRLLVGTRVTIVGVAEALVVILLLSVPFGLLAGYFGGRFERAVMWVGDLAFSIPGIVVVLMVLAVFRYSMLAAMITYGVLVSPLLMRVVRAAVLPVKQELYITAARVSGVSRTNILIRHVLPRIAGPVIVQASLLTALALLVQTGLAFLGLLIKEPTPSWGGMIADGSKAIILQPWLIWPPGIAIALTTLVLGLLGDVVRDTMTETWSVPMRRRRRRAKSAPAPAAAGASPVDADGLLAVRGLNVAFASGAGETRVVEDVSFSIGPGETVGVVGESGCGKSATAMAILGLLPPTGRIQSGNVYFQGRDLTTMSERELHRLRGKGIGLISQEPMVSLNPTFRVGWQLTEVVRRHHDVSRGEAKTRVLELLARVRLPDPQAVARRYPHELSGGMAQRVAIARALAGGPKLLIADEPTTALDVTVQADILELLRDLQSEEGLAILLVTHDWGVVADICERAVVLYAGQVVEQAPIEPIFAAPLHPYTSALIAASPHGAQTTEDLPTIPGSVPRPGDWPEGCHFHPRCRFATAACAAGAIPLERPADSRATRCIHYEKLEVSA
jgi:peptide/nickel transport system permease protein